MIKYGVAIIRSQYPFIEFLSREFTDIQEAEKSRLEYIHTLIPHPDPNNILVIQYIG